MPVPRIFIDADACPVKDEVYRVAERYGLKVFVVSNGWINTRRDPWIEQVVGDAGPVVADDWFAARAGPGASGRARRRSRPTASLSPRTRSARPSPGA